LRASDGQTLRLTEHETVTVRDRSPEALEVEAVYSPGGRPPPAHFHPAQDEHFEVLEGTLHCKVDGVERKLHPGDTLDIPRGALHQMWNLGNRPARLRWKTRPPGRTFDWFSALDRVHREGHVDRRGNPKPLAILGLLSEYRDVIRLAGPDVLLRPALRVAARLGRLRGYRA
jgi:quercetin dioxygenase-like cupin family protein